MPVQILSVLRVTGILPTGRFQVRDCPSDGLYPGPSARHPTREDSLGSDLFQVFSNELPKSHDQGGPDPFKDTQILVAADQELRIRSQGTPQELVIIPIAADLNFSHGLNQVDPLPKGQAEGPLRTPRGSQDWPPPRSGYPPKHSK
ncbi:MAG: hypothetical protein M3Y08_11215 [Fibrobacterota bacterium]|nr:hypothetical protein [Fibrobacterota bacterium]